MHWYYVIPEIVLITGAYNTVKKSILYVVFLLALAINTYEKHILIKFIRLLLRIKSEKYVYNRMYLKNYTNSMEIFSFEAKHPMRRRG